MPKVGENAASRTGKPRRAARRPATGKVKTERMATPATEAAALEYAGGDRKRLRYNKDGSITVLNKA